MTQNYSQNLQQICDRFSLDILYAFGSRGLELKHIVDGQTEKPDPESQADFDLGVKVSPGKSLSVRDKSRLAIELEELFKIHHLDLVAIEEVDPFVAANIIRGERLFCRDEYHADNYELYILRRAGDLAPFERQRLDQILNR